MKENFREKMYPYSRILYKTHDSAGWYMGTMGVEKDSAKRYCEEQKSKGIWTDYKCYLAGRCVIARYPRFQPCSLSAYDTHVLTDLIYNNYEDKWYFPNEIMPLPETDAKLCKDFHLEIVPEDVAENGYPLDEKESFENVYAYVKFLPCEYEFSIQMDLLNVKNFLKRLKKYGYAVLSVEEISFCKLLAWRKDEKILFILQSYDEDVVENLMTVWVPEQQFYAEFIKLDENIKYLAARLAMLQAEFKATELFLSGLHWEYDVEKPQEPQEYSLLSWNQDCLDKFKRFVRKVQREMSSYSKKTYFGKYKYWYDEKTGKLSREYRYRRGFAEFITSENFKYREGITLKEICKQQIEGGFYEALEGEWENKKFIIYANGDAIFKETKIHIPELEALVRQVVRDRKNKPTISTSKLWDLLREKGVNITSGYGRYSMKIKNL